IPRPAFISGFCVHLIATLRHTYDEGAKLEPTEAHCNPDKPQPVIEQPCRLPCLSATRQESGWTSQPRSIELSALLRTKYLS
ncbi:hypothetical protein BDW68DRAFT_154388, partial [Aspergillus falconensis]